MKTKRPFVGFVVLIGIILIYWLCVTYISKNHQILTEKPSSVQTVFTTKTNTAVTQLQKVRSEVSTSPSISEAVKEYVQKVKADPAYDWKQPINFYGRVVDESNEPVSDASAHFVWNDLSAEGTSEADATSDANGIFSLFNRTGKRLLVSVSKEGYYSSGDARNAAFEYANPADGLFTPDPMKPVVFHLRKKGVGIDLVTSKYGVKDYFGVTVPLDGTPVQADLLERKTGQGQITVSQIKPEFKNWQQATNWFFRMEISDGGFIEQNDEFPFMAPEDDYQSVVEFNFQKGQPDWIENLQKTFYIKFGNPARYGWLKLDTSIMMEGARFTYAINPDGSRNLEPK